MGAAAALLYAIKGKLEIFLGGGGLILHYDPLRGNAVEGEPVEHRLRLAYVLTGALASADNGSRVRILFEIFQCALEPVHQRHGGSIPMHRRPQHHQIVPLRFRVGAGVFYDGDLHDDKINKPNADQDHHHAPERPAEKVLHYDERGNKGKRMGNIGITPQSKAEHKGRYEQQRRKQAPEGNFMEKLHWLSASHFSYSAISSSFRGSFSESISRSF